MVAKGNCNNHNNVLFAVSLVVRIGTRKMIAVNVLSEGSVNKIFLLFRHAFNVFKR